MSKFIEFLTKYRTLKHLRGVPKPTKPTGLGFYTPMDIAPGELSAPPSTTLRDAQGDSDSLSDAQAQLNQVDNRSAESAPEGER